MNKELERKIYEAFGTFTSSLHTHVKSIFDAHILENDLCDKIIEMGGKGIVCTDHGVLTSIESYRRAFSSRGLKFIPGVEFYIDGGILGRLHGIAIAKNDNGYKAICKAVTLSNKNLQNGYPVISQGNLLEILAESKGDVFFLSACMQGVLCSTLLQNSVVERKIAKLQNKIDKICSDNGVSQDVVNAKKEECISLETSLTEAIAKRDNIKAIAEQKFGKRESAIVKAEKAGENVELLKAELENDKAKAKEATNALEEAKTSVDKAKKALSKTKAELKTMSEKFAKTEAIVKEINDLRVEIKDEAELYAKAKETALLYQSTVGKEYFYIELQYHGIEDEAKCFPLVANIAKELGIPVVATNDVHILTNSSEDRLKRQILRSLRFGDDFEEEGTGDSELYLKNNMELANALSEILPEDVVFEAIGNIGKIFDACDVKYSDATEAKDTGKYYPHVDNANEKLDELINKGIAWRFPQGMPEGYAERLSYELDVIKSMGYADYHLVVADFLEYGSLLGYVPEELVSIAPITIDDLKRWIEKNGWTNKAMTTGAGRGSAAGSLACYLMGITSLDPIKYGLKFERFLNPERVSMPDIDSDFANNIRGKAIEYVQNKYGVDAVCGIITMNAQAPKGSINIAAKFYGLKKNGTPLTSLGRQIAKDVPSDVGVSFATIVDASGAVSKNGMSLKDYLLKKYASNEDAKEIIAWATVVEGSFTAYGSHAAGVVIAGNGNVSDATPLRMNTKIGMMTTQCDMAHVEENGLLKFDFLGLKTLDVISACLRMIERNHGLIIDPLKISLEDADVYKNIFSMGQTNSVFQFESNGMKSMLKRFKPETFEDLIILVSMFRPGPLQFLDDVIDVKNGKKEVTFLHPMLESILAPTYGAICYQEQVMDICHICANFSLGRADGVRKYMSKKKADKLAHEREAFVDGCKENGINENIANKLFDQMMDFASYAFNKSHAACYAYTAYITAWLKYHYPAEFLCSALNWANTDKYAGLMYEASLYGVKVYAPDINLSDKKFSVVDGAIRFGLSSVAGVKDHADEMIKERKNGVYTSLKNFCLRVKPSSLVLEHLIASGALDFDNKNREALKTQAEEIADLIKKIREKDSFIKSAELVLPIVEKSSDEDIIKAQTDAGLSVEVDASTTADKLQKRINTAKATFAKLNAEFEAVRYHDIKEDKVRRMNLEKEYLGAYITEHPMDFYPTAKEKGIDIIDNLSSMSSKAYGVITNLEIKGRKSDGAKMAFFTLEDRSGSVNVSMFTKAYAACASLIEEGKVVMLNGNCEEREGYEEGEVEICFIANTAENVAEKLSSYMMSVSSYAIFHVDIEESFKKQFEDNSPKGHQLLIFDEALNEVRMMTYKVSEKVLSLPKVTETWV